MNRAPNESYFGLRPDLTTYVPSVTTTPVLLLARFGHFWKIEITESGALEYHYSADNGQTFTLISSFLPI